MSVVTPSGEDWSRLPEWVGGTVVSPVGTLRDIGRRQAWLQALAVVATLAALRSVAEAVAVAVTGYVLPEAIFPDISSTPLAGWSRALVALSIGSSLWNVVWQPVMWLIVTAIHFGIAYVLGGRGQFAGLLAARGFATIPYVLTIPFAGRQVLALVGPGAELAGALLAAAVVVPVMIWSLVLQVIAVRETMSLSTGRAALTVLLPVAAVVLFLALLICVVLALMLALIERQV